jgi:hypothetical protein
MIDEGTEEECRAKARRRGGIACPRMTGRLACGVIQFNYVQGSHHAQPIRAAGPSPRRRTSAIVHGCATRGAELRRTAESLARSPPVLAARTGAADAGLAAAPEFSGVRARQAQPRDGDASVADTPSPTEGTQSTAHGGRFAPVYPERPLESVEMAAVRQALETTLRHHEPFPALVVDRQWNLVLHNAALDRLIGLLGLARPGVAAGGSVRAPQPDASDPAPAGPAAADRRLAPDRCRGDGAGCSTKSRPIRRTRHWVPCWPTCVCCQASPTRLQPTACRCFSRQCCPSSCGGARPRSSSFR